MLRPWPNESYCLFLLRYHDALPSSYARSASVSIVSLVKTLANVRFDPSRRTILGHYHTPLASDFLKMLPNHSAGREC